MFNEFSKACTTSFLEMYKNYSSARAVHIGMFRYLCVNADISLPKFLRLQHCQPKL